MCCPLSPPTPTRSIRSKPGSRTFSHKFPSNKVWRLIKREVNQWKGDLDLSIVPRRDLNRAYVVNLVGPWARWVLGEPIAFTLSQVEPGHYYYGYYRPDLKEVESCVSHIEHQFQREGALTGIWLLFLYGTKLILARCLRILSVLRVFLKRVKNQSSVVFLEWGGTTLYIGMHGYIFILGLGVHGVEATSLDGF